MLYQYTKETNMSVQNLHQELSVYLNKASKIKKWNIKEAALSFLNEKSENFNTTEIKISKYDKEEWKFISAMIKFYTLITENNGIKDWAINHEYLGLLFLEDKIRKSNVTKKNLGSILIKTLNLVLNHDMKKCEKPYIDRLHQLFTIPGQNVSLPDIAYMYSIMDHKELSKNSTFENIGNNYGDALFYEPPESLINLKESFVTCFKTVGNNTSDDTQLDNNFDEILTTELYTDKSPCSELEKYSQCKEYCNWHKNVFNQRSREEFLTMMRYSMPQRKISLDPILLYEKNIAEKLFGSKNVKKWIIR